MNNEQTIRKLREENETLRERIIQLEKMLSDEAVIIPMEWKLSPSERTLVKALVTRPLLTMENALSVLYSARAKREATEKIFCVFIFRMRKKLKPFNVKIRTHHGAGYSLDPVWREKLKKRQEP